MKLLFISTHINQTTGYSKVSYEILKALSRTKHTVTHFGFQKSNNQNIFNNRKIPGNVKIVDVSSHFPTDPFNFGYELINSIINNEDPDIILIYNDAQIICNFLEKIDIKRNVVAYLDQVYENQNKRFIDIINNRCKHIFTFSSTWDANLKKYNNINVPSSVVKHGVNKNDFKIIDRDQYRKVLGLPENSTIFLNMNRNTSRKRIDITIMAFARLFKKQPEKNFHLLLVCDSKGSQEGGWNLEDIIRHQSYKLDINYEKFNSRIFFVENFNKMSDSDINIIYNVSDIGLNSCTGEGVGLCNLEHGSLGKPQITTSVGGLVDFVKEDMSFPINSVYNCYMANSSLGGYESYINPDDMAKAMEKYLIAPELIQTHGERIRKHITENFVWETETTNLIQQLEFTEIDLLGEVKV